MQFSINSLYVHYVCNLLIYDYQICTPGTSDMNAPIDIFSRSLTQLLRWLRSTRAALKLSAHWMLVPVLDSLCWFSQHRSPRQVLCARCVQCDVSPARMALFTFCVMRCDLVTCHIFGGCTPLHGLWPPNSNSVEIFVQCFYPQVSSSYVYSLVVNVLRNT